MHPNSFDSYNDINQTDYSVVAIVLEYMGIETLDDIFQTPFLQNQFARNYSTAKRELFTFYNQIDFKFCVYKGTSIKTTDSQDNVTYYSPTNWIRFLHNDKWLNNNFILAKNRSDFWQSLYQQEFYYIGYVKDSNPDIKIPFDFMEIVACTLLTSKKTFTDGLSIIDLQNLNYRYIQALQRLKDSYL